MNKAVEGARGELEASVGRFMDAPTAQNQEALMQSAIGYREWWIEARSASSHAESSTERLPSTRYKRVLSVNGKQPDGTELLLALQSRTSAGESWHVVSWRSRLIPGGHNRRFYLTNDTPWALPAVTALEMLSELERIGGLANRYDDLRGGGAFEPEDEVLNGASNAGDLLEQVTIPGEDWGRDPFLVVLGDPNSEWRKIMILNRDTSMVTFRSTTTATDYMPRAIMRAHSNWFLDNSMQDVDVQQARVFLGKLRAELARSRK